MGSAISTHQASPVKGKHHGQVLQSHIVNELVVAALQEGGVNGHHRLEALTGQASRKSNGMLLGNADIVITVWKAFVKLHHA